jgi:hypothetical protein
MIYKFEFSDKITENIIKANGKEKNDLIFSKISGHKK